MRQILQDEKGSRRVGEVAQMSKKPSKCKKKKSDNN